MDVTSKFHLSQVDSLRSVEVDIPIYAGTRSVATVQVPQVMQQHFEEEFTWPVGKVLVLSFGMTGSPIPSTARRTLYAAPRRQEVLVFLNVSAPMLKQYRRSGGEYSISNSSGDDFRFNNESTVLTNCFISQRQTQLLLLSPAMTIVDQGAIAIE